MKTRHFYFKYTKGNKGFLKLLKSDSFDEQKIPLPIYFGKWLKDEYYQKTTNYEIFAKNIRQKKQIDLFFNIIENQHVDVFFWIFLSDEIYSIKLQKPFSIYDFPMDVPDFLTDEDGSIPKCYLGKLENKFCKSLLPESFSNVNSNQKYNHQTIVELDGHENEVAEKLVRNSIITYKTIEEGIRLLSPVQFETLIFLIFVEKKIYCSTFRGGTKEKYDLLIENRKEVFPEFQDGVINIQIKKKEFFIPSKSSANTIFIYLGETNQAKFIFGIDWILKQIKSSEYVNYWVKRSLKFYELND
jgi:hypothetical protein